MSTIAPTVTVASGYYNNTMPLSYHRTNQERRIARTLSSRGGRMLGRVMSALNGVAPGAAVNDTYVRVQHGAAFSITSLGGLRPVETVTLRNAVTTTADRDYINNNIYAEAENQFGIAYPRDLSGNGGGGKQQR